MKPGLRNVGLLDRSASEKDLKSTEPVSKKIYKIPGFNDRQRAKYTEIIRRFNVSEAKLNLQMIEK